MSLNKFLDEACSLFEFKKKENIAEFNIYGCEDEILNKWINEKRYNDLCNYASENFNKGQWDTHLATIEKAFLRNKQDKYFIKLWKTILRYRFESLWDWNKDFGKKTKYWDSTEKTYEFQKFSLEGLKKFKDGLVFLNSLEEIEKVEKLIISVENLEKPKPKPTTDKRKIDDNIFWDIIEIARNNSENNSEFIEVLSNNLESFKATEIRRFEKIFLTKFEELNYWEIWALAYIVQRGCGNDGFDYFKSWVISKGQKAFETIKDLDVNKLKTFFDEDSQLEEMLNLAENVYELKTGALMQPVIVKKQRLLGKKWSEENIESEFPILCKIFDYKSNSR